MIENIFKKKGMVYIVKKVHIDVSVIDKDVSPLILLVIKLLVAAEGIHAIIKIAILILGGKFVVTTKTIAMTGIKII
tara:strand:+ start:417 stop:647 length:231 start_codon:yes stop_codon:yes gene_type:complete